MIDVYDNVLENHEAQFVHHLLTDQEFMWQYQHRSDNTKPIYHWHRHAGKNDSDLQNNNFEWLIPIWSNFINKYDFKEKYGVNTYRRIYFNAHTHGIEPQPHKDDGDFTMIYYPIMDWKKIGVVELSYGMRVMKKLKNMLSMWVIDYLCFQPKDYIKQCLCLDFLTV